MSRTIRRKTKRFKKDDWVFFDHDAYSMHHGHYMFFYHQMNSDKAKKALAIWYSDAGCGDRYYGSNSSFARKVELRKFKAKCKQALIKYLKGEEDCILPTYKHDWLD